MLQLRGFVTGIRTQLLFGYRHEYLVQFWVMKQWKGACASVGIAASCCADNAKEAKIFQIPVMNIQCKCAEGHTA